MTPTPPRFRLRRGLDIVVGGAAGIEVESAPAVHDVGVVAADYPGLRPRTRVKEGDRVRLGEPLFEDRRRPRIQVTAPGAGRVVAIHRGPGRAVLSIEIALGEGGEVTFDSVERDRLGTWPRERVADHLLRSGLWTALRTRPFSRVPDPDAVPRAIVVSALESEPLAPPASVQLAGRAEAFSHGLVALTRLTEGAVWVCRAPDDPIPEADLAGVRVAEFSGPHPAGLSGTHVHHLAAVARDPRALAGDVVWTARAQDVVAIGELFRSGRLSTERIVALAGPLVRRPRLVRTRQGACTEDLLRDALLRPETRVISGSVLSGRRAASWARFLGRFHTQVCALPAVADAPRDAPLPMLALPKFERLLPWDLLVTPLLRALAVNDVDAALDLGALQLDPEDLALCSYVCPARIDYGARLRQVLDVLETQL